MPPRWPAGVPNADASIESQPAAGRTIIDLTSGQLLDNAQTLSMHIESGWPAVDIGKWHVRHEPSPRPAAVEERITDASSVVHQEPQDDVVALMAIAKHCRCSLGDGHQPGGLVGRQQTRLVTIRSSPLHRALTPEDGVHAVGAIAAPWSTIPTWMIFIRSGVRQQSNIPDERVMMGFRFGNSNSWP